ncbi:phosphoenolpyruvate carboxylase [Caulobacter flavus]|uniref:Phosphoenolpyruvate carboxylase n=1 Tax=Caulobacter flavus TaxID=1679497 RepID=A0A2N5CMQ7_9CAUL|nr:phosphoenolpyruvate carboxylase [Caulobacter flavus]AYV47080.1 phosphoenolpyruvate carboxylase [Caulobacter flavus]PLR07402.1 phosphoenolpyruvate carboxylase [Caulobacter flavus]
MRDSALSLGASRPTSRDVRQNANLLGDLLIEAIGYLEGEEAAGLVSKARKAAAHETEEGEAPGLDHLFADLSNDQAVFLARAFASHSLLANIGEDVAGRRRHAEADARPGDERARTLVDAVTALKASGKTDADLAKIFAAMNVVPVLTAHPTEVRRRSMVDRETEISRLMSLRRHHLPADLEADIRERLFREIALMWRTRLYRPERITVKDEIRNALSIVRTSILPAMVDLYEEWSGKIGSHGHIAPLLKMGSWLGGDRDGHPGVNGDTLKLALSSQSRVILDWYAGEVRKLWSNLAVSTAYTPVSDELLALAAQAKDPSVHRLDEPYRLALELIFDRLTAVSQKLTGQWVAYATSRTDVEPYAHPDAFVADLQIIIESLEASGGERLVGSALRTLVAVAKACGFHLMSLDLRQNADVHERTIHELYQRSGSGVRYLDLDEEARSKLLIEELSHQRPLVSPFTAYGEETAKELATMEAAAQAVRDYGHACIGAYIISKSATLSDILEPLVLLKQVGLVWGGAAPRSSLKIAPLFETIEDLENGPRVLRQWLELPISRTILGDRPVQEIMLGYSDSNKDGGYVASRRGVARGASALAFEADRMGVGIQLFHGRGGSVGRGGGPAAEAVLAQPAGTVQGRIRMTEQGEMIARRFGDQPTARRNLDGLAAAVVQSSQRDTHRPDPKVEAAMTALAQASFEGYRALVYDDPAFEDFFWSATPIGEIVGLNIGSRPASRTASRKIEDLRAIPWVFSWSQARFMLPGWYGFASGVARADLSTGQLQDLAGGFDFFASLLSNMELALAQSHMGIAARYVALAPDQDNAQRIFDTIKREHDAAQSIALAIRGGASLLDNQPELAESVALAGHSVDPLNHLQLELLARRRGGEQAEDVRLAIQLTVAGIAAGLRNTG